MNRLTDIPPDRLTAEQKTVFDNLTAGRGRILGPYKVWIHSPTVAAGMGVTGKIPFISSYATFSPGRKADMRTMSSGQR